MSQDRKKRFSRARRAVVKIGSGLLTERDGLNLQIIRSISGQICRLMDSGLQIILVSSGAMASGIRKIGLTRRPDEIPKRQAVAAVGQAGLIMAYEEAFEGHNRKVAQILLTSDDTLNRKRYLNARNTLNTLLSWQVVPIINENDTIRIEEIQLGDNDNLAAMISLLMDVDILVNLTDIDGLYDRDPRVHADAALLNEIPAISRQIEEMAGDIPGPLGAGGMLSKIKAAKKVTTAGIPMVIANGRVPGILEKLFAGEPLGTYFVPKNGRLASRKRWIGFTLKPKGTIVIDQGAASAIVNNGKSLLPSGITGVEGDFRVGDPVALTGSDRRYLGMGLVNYTADNVRKIMGLKTSRIADRLGAKPYDEVIHRDNLVVTPDA